jgi:histidyl-tRNA synthetase
LYYLGPSFRRERPQKGRQRQFHQFGIEAIGSFNPEQDAEVIALGWEILSEVGINNLDLKISSIGSEECRNKYKNALVDFFKPQRSKLSDVSQQRLENNPLRILDTKNKNEIELIKTAPKIEEFYTKEDQSHFKQVQEYLTALEIPFNIDPLLVRGLDYYTQTTFEIISNDIGAQDALLGGGRYDGLIMSLGGKDTPAVGFAAGMERILLAINNNTTNKTTPTIYIVCVENDAIGSMQKIAKDLRSLGLKVLLETLRRSMKAQMREANKCNANYAIIVGEQEQINKTVELKNLSDGNQETIDQKNLFNHFKSLTF